MKNKPIEAQLFTWEEWDDVDNFSYQFYKCTCVKDFGPFKKGEKVDIFYLDFENSKLQTFSEDGEVIWSGELVLGVR